MTTAFTNTVPGEHLVFKASLDGGATYNAVVIMNDTSSLTLSTSTVDNKVIDNNNPTAPSKEVSVVDSIGVSISGSGMMDANSYVTFYTLASNGTVFPGKYIRTFANATANALTTSGTFIITNLQETGKNKDLASVSITLKQSDTTTTTTS